MANQKLNVSTRDVLGRKVKSLRKEGVLPANIYGKKIKSLSVQVNENDFMKVFSVAGETSLVDLHISSGKSKKEGKTVLITNVQTNPVTDKAIHVDFHQVDLKEKVTASVPIETLGESPAEKQGLGTTVVHINEIEVEALPMDLPDNFEIDLSKLTEVNQSVLVKELDYDKKKIEVKIDLEEVVVKVEPLREEEEEPTSSEEEVEGEDLTDETKADGEQLPEEVGGEESSKDSKGEGEDREKK